MSPAFSTVKWFAALGWQRGFVWPEGDPDPGFGAVCSEKAEIFLCRSARGSREGARTGYVVTYPPTDEPWGVREFHLRHADGHMFRVSARLDED